MSLPSLIIDAGHGGRDYGGGSNDSFLEKDMNLKISLYQYDRFKSLGVPVILTRKEDSYLSSSDRSKIVRESMVTYCISNHINASSNQNAKGVETIHSIYSDGELAKKICYAIAETGISQRRVFSKESYTFPGKDYYYMHRDTGKIETIIIEYGFATNKEDSLLLERDWGKFAESVVKCFCEYTGYKYVMPEEEYTQIKFPQIIEKVKLVYGDKEIAAYITTENKSIVELKILSEILGYSASWDDKNKIIILKKNK